jgi:hypothetical protein
MIACFKGYNMGATSASLKILESTLLKIFGD